MEASPSSAPGLKRSLSVWAAVGLSVALMAPSGPRSCRRWASGPTRPRGRKLGAALAAREGIVAPGADEPAPRLAAARDEAP